MAKSLDPLKTYRAKRDFDRTPEPSGETRPRRKAEKSAQRRKPRFVVQKHDARRLHYDFRLEVDGVLKSWAVPKGPSLDPRVKRLAVRTEDHPLDYARFEGIIPEGEYGAGTVIVWDEGTYRNLMQDKDEKLSMAQAIDAGHVEVWLQGRKLRGGFALVRLKPRAGERRENWLLIKMRDEAAVEARHAADTADPESVLSGRTLEEVEAEENDV